MNPTSELPSNPMSMLRLMPSRDVEVARFSKGIIEAVKQGHANPLEVLVMLRSLEAVSELVREEIEENINKEVDKYAEKKIEAFGAIIEKAEVGVKYDFNVCKDPTYERLEVDFNTAKTNLDQRKEFLKTLVEPIITVQPETGEVVEVRPPFKKSKQGTRVYLKHRT